MQGAIAAGAMPPRSIRRGLADYLALTKPRVTTLVLVTTAVGFYLGSGTGFDLALLLKTLIGRPDEALVEMQAARDLDPLSPTIQRSLGTLYYWTRRYELAIQEFRDALELDPGVPQARAMLARALARQGKLEEPTREIDLVGNSLLDRTERALIQALTGQRASALQALEEIKRDPAVRYLVPTVVAETYGALGDLDQAFEWMEVAFQEKDPSLLVMLADQNPSRLRSDPRSDDLRRRIGFPES